MKIRKALSGDIEQIERIYTRIHDEEESGRVSIGWNRSIYPVRKTAEDSLKRGDLFVMEDAEAVVACAIINQAQVPEYALAPWENEAEDSEVMVLHTLVVDPSQGAKGFGKAFVLYYEQYAAQHHCGILRLDTNALNVRAREMYRKLGYSEAGIVPCRFNGIPDVQLVCLEKRLPLLE